MLHMTWQFLYGVLVGQPSSIDMTYNHCHIILRHILILNKNFLLPQVKRIVIISKKHGIYDLPYELPNNLGSLEIKKYR